MKIMNNRGVSGVEMIVSFTLFFGFVLFIFAYMNPLSMPVSRSLLTTLENAVKENASMNIEAMGFAVNKTMLDSIGGARCFSLEDEAPLNSVFITDHNGNEVAFQNGTKNVNYTGEKFYYINNASITGKQTPPLTGCIPLKINLNYSLSVERTYNVYYNRSLASMKELYYSNYLQLKNDLKFPTGSDFAVIVFDSNQNKIISMEKTTPRVNVMSKEFPIEILSDDSGIKIIKGYMRLLVW